MAFNVGEYSITRRADFKISNMMYKAGWKVKTNVTLSWGVFRVILVGQ